MAILSAGSMTLPKTKVVPSGDQSGSPSFRLPEESDRRLAPSALTAYMPQPFAKYLPIKEMFVPSGDPLGITACSRPRVSWRQSVPVALHRHRLLSGRLL